MDKTKLIILVVGLLVLLVIAYFIYKAAKPTAVGGAIIQSGSSTTTGQSGLFAFLSDLLPAGFGQNWTFFGQGGGGGVGGSGSGYSSSGYSSSFFPGGTTSYGVECDPNRPGYDTNGFPSIECGFG